MQLPAQNAVVIVELLPNVPAGHKPVIVFSSQLAHVAFLMMYDGLEQSLSVAPPVENEPLGHADIGVGADPPPRQK